MDTEFDQKHIWHPYTNLTNPTQIYPVESADGVYLNLAGGKQLLDGMSSWWSCIHGYNHPVLNQPLLISLIKFFHACLGG